MCTEQTSLRAAITKYYRPLEALSAQIPIQLSNNFSQIISLFSTSWPSALLICIVACYSSLQGEASLPFAMLPSWVAKRPLPDPRQDRPSLQNSSRAPPRAQRRVPQENEPIGIGSNNIHANRGSRDRDRHMPYQQSSGIPPARPAGVIPAEWAFCRSVIVTLRGLPPWTTLLSVRDNFCQYGNVAFIEIDEERGNGPRTVRFRFEPPPKDNGFFQDGYCSLHIGNRWHRAPVVVSNQLADTTVSPHPLEIPAPDQWRCILRD